MGQYIFHDVSPTQNEIKCQSTVKVIQQGCKDGNFDVIKSAIEDYEKSESPSAMALLADTRSCHWNSDCPHYIIEMAASSFKPKILALILKKDLCSIRYCNNYKFPIYWLVKSNYNKKEQMDTMKVMMKLLCYVGYSVNEQYHGHTPLNYVCNVDGDNSQLVKILIEAGAHINYQDFTGKTPLHYVCESDKQKLELVKTLIDSGAGVHYPDYDGLTPLHHVCRDHGEHLELARTLIEAGAHVNDKDHKGHTPLHYACIDHVERMELVKVLIEAGSDVNFLMKGRTSTALYYSVVNRKPHLSQYLLNKGADWTINATDMVENLVICRYVDDSSRIKFLTTLKILKILIAYGLDINKYLDNRQINYLLGEHEDINPEESKEMCEFLRQSGLRFNDVMLQATSWISTTPHPLSLQRLCANKIRKCIGPKINKNINVLAEKFLPTLLKDFIMLKDLINLDTL